MSLVGVSRPSAVQAEQHESGEDAVARNIRRVVERVSARKRQEVEMHVAAVVRQTQARTGGIPPRPTPVPRVQPPSEEALQARFASAAQAAAARATQAASGADGGLFFASGGDVHTRTSISTTTAVEDTLQSQVAAALEAAKQRAGRPAGGAREHLQAQAAAALEAAKQRAAGGAGGVTPVPEAALQARARQAAGDAMERQRAAAVYESSVEAKILWAMAAATYRSATEDSDEWCAGGVEAQEHDEGKKVALGNGSEAALTAVTATKAKAVRFDEEVEVESPSKIFGGC